MPRLAILLFVPVLLAADLTPPQAAKQQGKTVTVRLVIKGIGANPSAGCDELYSHERWNALGCFFVRLPKKVQTQFKKQHKGVSLGEHFLDAEVRVTGKVQNLNFGKDGTYACIEIDDLTKIKVLARKASFTAMKEYATRTIAGFKVLVHPQVEKHTAEAKLAYKELTAQLQTLQKLLPTDRVTELKKVPIWLEWDQPRAKSAAQFHPSAGWLKQNGYNPAKANAVEISNVKKFVAWSKAAQPYMVLHELAHAYHFRVLGGEHAGVKTAYKQAMDRKLYESVAHVNGQKQKAYAMTNDKEYFAELTEAYWGKNDFYPFNRQELKKHDPVGFKLMKSIWEGKK